MHFVLLTAALVFAGDTGMSPERLARIPARMQSFVESGTAAGFVTLVARHGQLANLSAVGYQDRESKTPMRTDTIFQIMSMSKPITGWHHDPGGRRTARALRSRCEASS